MDVNGTLLLQEQECERRIVQDSYDNPAGRGCRVIWDGIMCWQRAEIGQLASSPCPTYIPGFDVKASATKLCTAQGWWVNTIKNNTWTNFTACSKSPYIMPPLFETPAHTPLQLQQQFLPVIQMVSLVGYSLSLGTLIIAFLILACNKKLRCQRNLLHLHLFVSFIMRALMAVLKESLFVEGVGLSSNTFTDNGELVYTREAHRWECKVFTTLWQYFIMANYSWILVEGIYLHNLIFLALFSDTSSIRWHILLGWSLPAVFVLPWAALRALYEDTFCWTTHRNKMFFMVIRIPTVTSIVINLILFINITRVLLSKLNSIASQFIEGRISRYRKWAKSTLVLMPLYGFHYALLLGMSYSESPVVEIVWLFLDQTFASSQGFCVALLYCLFNGEVENEMRGKWHKLKNRLRGGAAEDTITLGTWRKASTNTRSVGIGQPQVTGC